MRKRVESVRTLAVWVDPLQHERHDTEQEYVGIRGAVK